MATISFCSFLSGVGSCAAFQAALKTGTVRVQPPAISAYTSSNPQLADTPRIGDCLSIGRIWVECLLLYSDSWHCFPGKHIRVAHDALISHLSPRSGVYTVSHCRRSSSWYRLRSPSD